MLSQEQAERPEQPERPERPESPVIAQVAGARAAPGASAIYEGFRAQRNELTNQMNDLEGTRNSISGQLEELPAGSPQRQPLEARLIDVDARIKAVDQMLAANAAQLSQAAGIPGAVVEPPQIIRSGPPEEAWVLGGMFIVIVLLPISIAFARRIWRRPTGLSQAAKRSRSNSLGSNARDRQKKRDPFGPLFFFVT